LQKTLSQNDRMKTLLVTASFPPMSTGGADYAFRLCQYLAQENVTVHVITGQTANQIISDKIQIYPVMKTWSWLEMLPLLRLIRGLNPDVINLHFGGFLYNDHPMITFLPTLAKWLVPSTRFVTLIEAPIGVRAYLRSFPVRTVHKLLVKFTRQHNVDYSFGTLLMDSDSLIVLSGMHQALLANYDASVRKKSVLIPPPPLMRVSSPDGGEIRKLRREKLGISNDDLLIAYLGYLYPGKGIETLLTAFKIISSQRRDVQLLVIGGTPDILLKSMNRANYLTELQQLADQLAIPGNVIWTGPYTTDSEEPSQYLRASDLCVLPFDQGVFLNNSSFASCAAHGLPIITTKGDNLETPFKDQENVLLCPPKDPDALAKAILRLINDPNLRLKLGKNGHVLAEALFSWPKAIAETLAVFKGEKPLSLI